jgi:hypothetical protein
VGEKMIEKPPKRWNKSILAKQKANQGENYTCYYDYVASRNLLPSEFEKVIASAVKTEDGSPLLQISFPIAIGIVYTSPFLYRGLSNVNWRNLKR